MTRYKAAAEKMFDEDKQVVERNFSESSPNSAAKERELQKIEENRASFK
jgi:hypothetical protein